MGHYCAGEHLAVSEAASSLVCCVALVKIKVTGLTVGLSVAFLCPSDQKARSVVLPLILPCFYPDLFMLYMLYHEREDHLYCQGILDLSLLPDIKLLEFLGVQK